MRNNLEPHVVFENDDLVVIDKPARMLIHLPRNVAEIKIAGHEKETQPTLVSWLLKNYPEIAGVGDDPVIRPGIVHRLDKGTSGLVLVARTQKYFEYLKRLFQERKIKKMYLALVYGAFRRKSGIIARPIGIKEGTVKRSVHSSEDIKEAVTEYYIVDTFYKDGEVYSLLEIIPKTGRTHQIRIHLASIGHPVLGDMLYGNKLSKALSTELNTKRQMLHAFSLEFEREPGRMIRLEAGPPADFEFLLDSNR